METVIFYGTNILCVTKIPKAKYKLNIEKNLLIKLRCDLFKLIIEKCASLSAYIRIVLYMIS